MFHVGEKAGESGYISVCECDGTEGDFDLIVSPVNSDSWFSQQSCKKITAATNKSLKRERERPL